VELWTPYLSSSGFPPVKSLSLIFCPAVMTRQPHPHVTNCELFNEIKIYLEYRSERIIPASHLFNPNRKEELLFREGKL